MLIRTLLETRYGLPAKFTGSFSLTKQNPAHTVSDSDNAFRSRKLGRSQHSNSIAALQFCPTDPTCVNSVARLAETRSSSAVSCWRSLSVAASPSPTFFYRARLSLSYGRPYDCAIALPPRMRSSVVKTHRRANEILGGAKALCGRK